MKLKQAYFHDHADVLQVMFADEERSGWDFAKVTSMSSGSFEHRAQIVDLIFDLCEAYRFEYSATFAMSIQMFDYMVRNARQPVPAEYQVPIAVVCLVISAKFYEKRAPSFGSLAGHVLPIRTSELAEIEAWILSVLKWRIYHVTPTCFLEYVATLVPQDLAPACLLADAMLSIGYRGEECA